MQHDSGAPAFDNIDDLLAEKIVTHSKKHTNHPDPNTPVSSVKQSTISDSADGGAKNYEPAGKSPHRLTTILLITLIAVSILYLFTHSSRNT